jgi:hypothetical protein
VLNHVNISHHQIIYVYTPRLYFLCVWLARGFVLPVATQRHYPSNSARHRLCTSAPAPSLSLRTPSLLAIIHSVSLRTPSLRSHLAVFDPIPDPITSASAIAIIVPLPSGHSRHPSGAGSRSPDCAAAIDFILRQPPSLPMTPQVFNLHH